ncbi:MAG: recombination mediator RecR [Candidatus Bipolaricaulia bacterium]
MEYPKPLETLIRELGRLPSIGRKTAERLAFYILSQDEEMAGRLSRAILEAKRRIKQCKICYNYSEEQICPICADPLRERATICVVSQPQELWKLEKTGEYRGLYHVLGGLISPVDGVAPEDLRIAELLERLQGGEVKEVILALDPKVEGEATAMYLARQIRPLGPKVTQIAHGVPIGRDLEFADELTLSQALRGRGEI